MIYDSIRNIAGLDIVVNVDSDIITVRSKSNDLSLEEIYKGIIAELRANTAIYRPLLSQVEYDSAGNIKNISYDFEKNEIIISNPSNSRIDIRYLDLPNRSIKKEITGSLNLKEYDGQNLNIGVVFKPEAVYAEAYSELGESVLKELSQLKGEIFTDSSNKGVYQFISFSSVIDTVRESKDFNSSVQSFEFLPIPSRVSETSEGEIVVYIEKDAEKYSSVIQELMEFSGYRIVVSEDKENSDLRFGYTWIYSNSFQSSLDNVLNDVLSNYCITSEEVGNLRFIFRSAWVLTE